MFFKSLKSLAVRFVLILTLLGGMPGNRNVQAAPMEAGDLTTVLVVSSAGTPLSGKPVYAFNGSTYTGYSKVTDANGEAALILPEGNYRFRVDVDGTQFWSGIENHCNNCLDVTVTVPEPVLLTVQDPDGTAMANLNVYAFDGATYTGYHGTTDQNGQRFLRLPEGNYRFRADLNGTQFWSGTSNHCAVPGCQSVSVFVSKPMIVTVLDTDGAPKPNLNVYAFNNSTYTGYNKTTNPDGQAIFTLPLGSYRFRADLNSTQFWSGTENHCTLPGCENTLVTVTLPITVTIQDAGGVPKSGVSVYAFNGSSYTGYSKVSDVNGQVLFTLPVGSYRFRADYSGIQYWSSASNHCTLPGCLTTSVTVGPAMTATSTPTPVPTDTPTLTPTVPARSIQIVQPNGGEVLTVGTTYRITWNSTPDIDTVFIGYKSCDSCLDWIATELPNLGYYDWEVWVGNTTNTQFKIEIIGYDTGVGSTSDRSDNYFAVLPPPPTDTPIPTYTPTPTSTPIGPTTRMVTTTGDSGRGSLRQAMMEAVSGDTIRFSPSLAGQTITLSTPVVINSKKLRLDGSGLLPQVTINGDGNAGIHLNGESAIDIYDLTISNLDSTFIFRLDATIKNSTLKGFTADVIYSYASLTILDSTLEDHEGRVIEALGTATIRDSVLRNNAEEVLRALSSSSSVTITNSTLSGNGGDVILANGPLTVIDSTFMNNHGLAITSNTSLTLIGSTISQNSAGALAINGGDTEAAIANSTITQNQGSMGEILVNGSSDIDILNSTIIADSGRLLFLNGPITFDAYNSILMCAHPDECFYPNVGAINNVNSILLVNGTLEALGLGQLADNGGPTLTMALLTGSSLIDAGNDAVCVSVHGRNVDQRGVSRPQGTHCDIGAYEYEQNVASTTTALTTSPNPSEPGQTVTVAATVSSASGTPTGTVDFSMDGTVICTRTLMDGVATCDLAFIETQTIVAAYRPDNSSYGSSSGSLVQTVGKSSTTLAFAHGPNPSLQGDSVTIDVMVTNVYGGGRIPTGTVTVSSPDGNCTITLSNGQGNCSITFNTLGTSTITLTYSGDVNHLANLWTFTHEVLSIPPTATNTPIPTLTSTPTSTPTPGPTPVIGCNSIRDTIQATTNPIKTTGRTMYLNIPNANPYPVTISSVFVAWNYAAGHTPGDSSLWLQKADLGGTVFWTGNLNQPSALLPLSTTVVIPANTTAKLTFTFDKTYTTRMSEQIQLQFSTPGCEAYPVIVPVGLPTITPVPSANLKVQLITGGTDNNQESQFHYQIQNTGASAVSNISVRLYFTLDGSNAASDYTLASYYDQSGAATILGPTLVSGNNYYYTVNYGTASLASGSTWAFQGSLHLSSWLSLYDGTNDWWHGTGSLPATWTDWNNILVYINGTRVWGILP